MQYGPAGVRNETERWACTSTRILKSKPRTLSVYTRVPSSPSVYIKYIVISIYLQWWECKLVEHHRPVGSDTEL